LRIAALFWKAYCRNWRLGITLIFWLNKSLIRFRLQIGFVCGFGRFHRGRGSLGPSWLLTQVRHAAGRRDDVGQIVVVLFQLHEVGDVEEGVALQADVDEGRLHAGKDASDATFVDGSCQGVLILALKIDFREQIVFDQAHFGFVGGGRDK